MGRWNLSWYAISACVAAALLAGCGALPLSQPALSGVLRQAQDDVQPPIGAPGVLPRAPSLAARTDSTNYKVVYSFSGGSDGANPYATLIYVGGTLYGTTDAGGSQGYGTVFSVTPGGTEKVLYSFGGGTDGKYPQAGLVDVGGTLYGTTTLGGAYTCTLSCGIGGTVFSITRGGTEKVLHNFSGYSDGSTPYAGLINVKRMLYGTTEGGGTPICYSGSNPGCGTVFSITTAGTERVLHDFSASPDGAYPAAGLIDLKGVLYGTTRGGGMHGVGTVFSITPDAHEKVLHHFGSGEDGWSPQAGLLNVDGTLYGDTSRGGSNHGGTVFSITPGGKEKVVHNFGDGTGGSYPGASLIELKGRLYGTTEDGGDYSCGSAQQGCGTVFSITLGGKLKVLHAFEGHGDGTLPVASLIAVKGTLYGTTTGGGANYDGTVFSLKP